MEKTITLKEALSIIDRVDEHGRAIPFDIAFRSLNKNSSTGGKLYEYKQVVKHRSTKKALTKQDLLADVLRPAKAEKNPNHFLNRTRNLQLQNKEIKKIHIRLIISINSNKVIY